MKDKCPFCNKVHEYKIKYDEDGKRVRVWHYEGKP